MGKIDNHAMSGREDRFCQDIQNRDKRCVIPGACNSEANMQIGAWPGFEAAHIYPLKHESLWIGQGLSRWISDMDNVKGCSKIHLAQNGFLLCSNVHSLYDQYFLAINPDDGYKVYVFCQYFLLAMTEEFLILCAGTQTIPTP